MLSVKADYYKIAIELLKRGADLTMTDNAGQTVVHAAEFSDHKDIFSLILKAARNIGNNDLINQKSSSGKSPLFLAVEKEAEQVLFDPDAPISQPLLFRQTAVFKPLMTIKDKLDLLIGYGADINQKNTSEKITALHRAVLDSDSSLVAFLLQKGANPLLRDKYGTTVLDLAKQLRNERATALLQTYLTKDSSKEYYSEDQKLSFTLYEVKRFYDNSYFYGRYCLVRYD